MAMSKRSHSSFAALIFACSIQPVGAADKVTIKTISTTGQPVLSSIFSSEKNSDWKRLEGVISENTLTVLYDKCDTNIRFKAESLDNSGLYSRREPDSIKYCAVSEVLFDDYVPSELALRVQPDKLSDASSWRVALGDSQNANLIADKYSAAFQSAMRSGDYGYLAVASSEVAASLRAAGKFDQASPFEALSVQSTLAGIVRAQGEKSISPALVPIPGTSRLVMSDEAKAFLEQYQSQKLGLSPDNGEWGKTGWTTMRSLPGGSDVVAKKWVLPDNLTAEFDYKAFSGKQEM
jgi:hypothetical protein